ncbi:hypothetical protein FJ978_08330 [Mesorhizobium sp. B1-1-7]|nr:hypothetical protein FJ978_08330 [Mesorhizobium sp. B1-1-7]
MPALVTSPMIEPLVPPFPSCSVPCWISQLVVAVPLPVSIQVLAPVFWKVSKFRYWAAAPMAETSKLPSAVPPRRRMSLVPSALPTIFP